VRAKSTSSASSTFTTSSFRSPGASSARAFHPITGKRWPSAAFSWSTVPTANLFVDRHKNYIGYGPEASELVGIPDPETFVQLPWDKRVARVFCTCFRNREEKVNPGGHLTSDCRGNLRLIHEAFTKTHSGLHLRHGCEPEMMWLKKGATGCRTGGFSKPNCYHIDQFESLRPVFYARTRVFARDGPGHDPGRSRGCTRAARAQLPVRRLPAHGPTRLTTYRQICAQVAARVST